MRRFLSLSAVAASLVLATAFAPTSARTVRDWTATLAGQDGRKVTGSAAVKPNGTGVEVTVTLDGDTPGATRPWHIHTGSCAKSGGVFGAARAYSPIVIDLKGHGSATAKLEAAPSDTTTYYVNIHDSGAAMGTIVACGDLAKH